MSKLLTEIFYWFSGFKHQLFIGTVFIILLIIFYQDVKDFIMKPEKKNCINCRNEMDPEDEELCRIFAEYWGYGSDCY